ncbi:hypothetical protein M422DRAFT_65192 [Sphaerobolus stellatus SS14]|nr:hypothetical protein M422DRAFT_65192 [Sphaerobolus stellatus SS14]
MSAVTPLSTSSEAITEGVLHLHGSLYMVLTTFIMLVYDHAITLDEEITRIWKRSLTLPSILFFINRYFTPFQALIVLVAFFTPSWSNNRRESLSAACRNFYRFEAGSTVGLVAVAERKDQNIKISIRDTYNIQVILMIRVYALWGKNVYILLLLAILWIIQVALSGLAMAHSKPLALPHGLPGCIETGNGEAWALFWIMPLVTDTVIFALTLWRTGRWKRGGATMPVLERFRRDGIMYFICIFSANLLNTVLFLHATEDLKAIGASFSQCITATMVSRLVLNLRGVDPVVRRSQLVEIQFHGLGTKNTLSTAIIGVLGEDFEMDVHTTEITVTPFTGSTDTARALLRNI